MKIAYFYRLDKFGTHKRFVEEAREMKMELVPIKYRKLTLDNDKILYQGEDLKKFDAFFFRAVGPELEWSKLLELYAKKYKITVVDEYLLTQGPLRRFKSVMGWQFFKAGVNYPKTIMVEKFGDLREEIKKWQFPLIVKLSKGGRHGMGTFLIKKEADLDELERKLDKDTRDLLIQEFFENDGDYRLFVVGYKTLGGFKRKMKEEKLVLNKSVGKSEGLAEVPLDVASEAEKAARAVEVEVAGIDLIQDTKTGKIYVVEVNEAPEFKVFEKRTGKNAVREILKYIKKKKTAKGFWNQWRRK